MAQPAVPTGVLPDPGSALIQLSHTLALLVWIVKISMHLSQ